MAGIEVLQPGLFSTVQDLGRFGFREFGVPQSGAMDLYAAQMANLIVGNEKEAAVLEITQLRPKLQFKSACAIAICGADISPTLENKPLQNTKMHHVKEGEVLSFGKRMNGCRAYLAVKGGISSEEILKSRSWYKGLSQKDKLEKGDILNFTKENAAPKEKHAVINYDKSYMDSPFIEVYPGPEFDFLPEKYRSNLIQQEFTIDKNNNRMAIQLAELFENSLDSIITGPVIPSTVQLTPSGTLVILMKDCQTTGGYPRILQLSENAMNTLSQKVVRDKIHFQIKK